MLRKLIVMIFMGLLFVLGACTTPEAGGNPPVIPTGEGDAKAQQGIDALPAFVEQVYYLNVAEKIRRKFSDARVCEDLWSISELQAVKNHFIESLNIDPNNAKGNLGMALMDLADLNCDSGIWALLSKILDGDIDAVKYTDINTVISADILPALERAISRLNITLADASFSTVSFKDTSDDEHIISKAEVYLLRGACSLLHAVIYLATAYDFHIVDMYDSYNWIKAEESFYSTLKPNFNRAGFLKLKSGKDLALVKTGLISGFSDLQNAHDRIMAQTGDVSRYFIKKIQISDLDQYITENNFIGKNWTSAAQVISWGKNLVSVQTEETINGETFLINPQIFFQNQLPDLNIYLPYHQWNGDQVEYLDAPLGSILPEGEYVFPDYTVLGTFPDMTKEKFDRIID